MKCLFLSVTLLITTAICCQVQTGVFAGPQATNVRYLINGVKQDSRYKMGTNLGVLLKVPFEGRLSFSPGIMYNYRGYQVEFSSPAQPPDSSAKDNNTAFHTIELSFLFQHDFSSRPGHFFFRIGPSLDFALFGKEKFNTKDGLVERNMIFSFSDYGHYLASAIFHFGYETANGLFVYAHYNYSLTTMNNHDGGPTILNRAAGISIGKMFKRRKPEVRTR